MNKVLAHGVWDVLHIGHLRLLKTARQLGYHLTVSVLGDDAVRHHKGSSRPINTLEMRMEFLASLRCVDEVVVVNGRDVDDVVKMIEKVRPDIYVKGAEYRDQLPEQAFCERKGIQVLFMDMQIANGGVLSTTRIMNVVRSE